MSRVPIKHIQVWFDKRLGRLRIRTRKKGHKSVTLPGPLGSPEFWQAYNHAFDNKLNVGEQLRSKPGSVSKAIAAYYVSREWEELSEGTRAMRRALLERFRAPMASFRSVSSTRTSSAPTLALSSRTPRAICSRRCADCCGMPATT